MLPNFEIAYRNRTPPARVYLGTPLVHGGVWYCLYEQDKKVRLAAIDVEKYRKAASQNDASPEGKGTVWDVEFFEVPSPVAQEPQRRMHTITLVSAHGLVICPTHLGYVVAADSAIGKQKWFFVYAPVTTPRFENFKPEWIVVPPAVVGDRYVYAPADFPELLCLNVADGKKMWSVKKGDGLYPAVVGEQVLVIEEKSIRSLRINDGSEQWKADLPGLPCGRGAVLGDAYLVPVSEPNTWKGLIAVVDLKAGKVAEVLRPEKDEPIGNLVVQGDYLISQTLTEIAVFPICKNE